MSRRLTASLLVGSLLACQEFLKVVADDLHSPRPSFRFCSGWFRNHTETVRLRTFTVRMGSEGTVAWEIESQAARIGAGPASPPPPLRKLEYGVAPEGFDTRVAPRPLTPGTTYRAAASLEVEGKEGVVGAGGEFVPRSP